LNPNPKTTGEASDYRVYEMEAEVDGKPNPQRENLIKMLNGTQVTALIRNIFPKFLKVSNRGMATPITQLMEPIGKPEFLLCALYEMFLYVKNSCIAL
jgi:hypothetical protein